MKHEWPMLHDLMAESVLGLIPSSRSASARRASPMPGAVHRAAAGSATHDADQRRATHAAVYALAATWRAHSGVRRRREPGSFTITEDDEKVTFTMNPCGSGQRLAARAVRGEHGYGRHARGARLVATAAGLPALLHALPFMNESLPIQWSGRPALPVRSAGGLRPDPCAWYWYKAPARHPLARTGSATARSSPGPASRRRLRLDLLDHLVAPASGMLFTTRPSVLALELGLLVATNLGGVVDVEVPNGCLVGILGLRAR